VARDEGSPDERHGRIGEHLLRRELVATRDVLAGANSPLVWIGVGELAIQRGR
jgi:hypothetical protein